MARSLLQQASQHKSPLELSFSTPWLIVFEHVESHFAAALDEVILGLTKILPAALLPVRHF